MFNILEQQLVELSRSTLLSTVSGLLAHTPTLPPSDGAHEGHGGSKLRKSAQKCPKTPQNRSKSAKFARRQHFPGKFAPYSDTWWLQVCLMAINFPTLLSTVSGSVINNQHQQLVEVKTTYSEVLTCVRATSGLPVALCGVAHSFATPPDGLPHPLSAPLVLTHPASVHLANATEP